jgi:hypothetical protein
LNQQTYQKLLSTGIYDKKWLDDTHQHFNSTRKGKYKLRITDILDLDDNIEAGIYIDTACFSTQEELSVIHHYFEGFCYILYRNETGEKISTGFIDGAIYDEIDEEGWEWLDDDQLRALKLIPLPEITGIEIHQQTDKYKYIATAYVEGHPVKMVYDFKPRIAKATEDLINKYLKEVGE